MVSEPSKPATLKQLERLEARMPTALKRLDKIEAHMPPALRQLDKIEAMHGGARPGAGRPRTKSLDVDELELLLKLLTESPYAAEYADTAAKLEKMVQAGGARPV